MKSIKMRCPFNECSKVIEMDLDPDLKDGDKIYEDCPGCKEPLEITLAILPGLGAMADCSPAPPGVGE